MGSLRGMEVLTREPSLTALDSPYRTALSILADLDWQYNDTGASKQEFLFQKF